MLDNLKNKKILILGLGREGISTYKILRRLFPNKVIGLADQQKQISQIRPIGPIRLHLGPGYLKILKDYDVVIKSPGIPHFPCDKITSQTKLFFENCPGKIIGVTGTKGKSTTASLIYKIVHTGCSASWRIKAHRENKVYLAGNIGKPVLSLLMKATKNDLFILELSSHQLADLKQSPHIAVWLNIYPEHQDYYKNIQEYEHAKANIAKFQTPNDYLIYNASDRRVIRLTKNSRARKISFSLTDKKADLYPCQSYIYFRHSRITPISLIPLIGQHNLQNIMAAIAVAKILKVPNSTINKTVKTFKPLPHRLELVGTFKGITFYNDSLATNPPAAIAAIETLKNVSTLITGGYDRGGMDFEPVGKAIIKAGIKTVILFPPTGQKIWSFTRRRIWRGTRPERQSEAARPEGGRNHFFVRSMEKAVRLAYHHTPPGTVCLLSCASPSFGIFKDYADRGNQFKKYVLGFGL